MESKCHQCQCGKSFNHRQSLLRHAKECKHVYTNNTTNCDNDQLQQQIIELKMELQRKDMELEKKELEYAYQLQLKDMEYQLKLQVLQPHIKTNKYVSVSAQQTTIECNNQPHGYVYIIQEREFYLQNIPVYKIGKTNQNGIQRYSSYPKGSKLILHIECSKNCHIVERKLIQLFKTKYNQRTDIGTEYFEGSKNTMINDVYNLAVEQELTILNHTNGLNVNNQVLKSW